MRNPKLAAALGACLLSTWVAGAVGAQEPDNGAFFRVGRAASEEQLVRPLELEVGKSVYVQTDFPVKRVSVGSPKIVEVVVLSPTELQLVASDLGATNLILWDSGGAPAAVLDANVGTSFTRIERQLRIALGQEDIHVESAGDAVILNGSVASPVHAERAVAIAQAFFPKEGEKKVVSALEVGGNQQVMIEVVIAEMNRTLGKRLTANWTVAVRNGGELFGFGSMLGSLTSLDERSISLSPAAISEKLNFTDRIDLVGTFIDDGEFLFDAFLEFAAERRLAKVLAKPTLIARSGQKASFLAGGEVPIPVSQGNFGAISIEFKRFGVGVEFSPTVLGPDRIYLEVAPEVSEPDFTLGTASAGTVTPGFITRRASTSVELGDGQSFAIAGLLQDNLREAIEKYPLLGDIPVLGALFRSSSFQRNETELVLIVTPRLVKPMRPENVRLPTDSFIAPSDADFFIWGRLEGRGGNFGEPEPEEGGAGLVGEAGYRLPIAID